MSADAIELPTPELTDLEPRSPPAQEPAPSAPLYLTTPGGTVPLGFAEDGPEIYLVARERVARWPVLAMRSGSVRVRTPSASLTARVDMVTAPEEKARVLQLFRSKYGILQFARWYDHPARVLRLTPERSGSTVGGPPAYVDWLTAEFDNIADEYDRHILENRINLLLRNRSLAELRSAFRDAPALLEIGCGSGTETLPLVKEGHELLCIDISQRMLDVVREKARREGVSERLRTRKLRAAELPQLLRELGPSQFDGAYSTYGALNCEADLGPIPPTLHALVRPDGRFVAGVYNRWCLVETVGLMLAGRPRRAWGRTRRPVPVGWSRFCIDVWAHSAQDFERLFAPWFRPARVEAVPAFLPSSEAAGFVEKFTRHFDRLAAWDRAWGTRWPLRLLGDHFLMTFDRAAGVPG